MKNVYTICYLSYSNENLNDDDISNLFASSSKKNEVNGITGILLHEMGKFFQVLEGEEVEVNRLYDIIKKDKRHRDLYLIFNRTTSFPVFKDYNSKFNIVKSYEDLSTIKAYLDRNSHDSTRDKLSRLLTPFLLMKEL